ncbi:MAG: anti-sigma factor [Bacteroidota bacterium]|nr:anti-sigma factor [Bacteroidota bacterium]
MDINSYISSGIIELYVMGMCSPEEEKELELLRRQHPALHDAVLQYETELEANMQKNSTLPPADVDNRILQSLDALQTPVIDINKNKKNRQWLRPVAAASILLLAVSAFYNYTFLKKIKNQELALKSSPGTAATLPAADYIILNKPTITPVAMYGVGTHAICRCTMFWDKSTGKMYIIIHHLPKSSAAKDYQLWAEVDGKPVNVGIIKDEIRGRFIEMPNVPAGSIAFTVTLENAGGTTRPTVEETYLSGKI